MPDSMENVSFDVEAQQSFLETPPEEGASESEETTNIKASQALMKIVLLIRSTEIFKLGANYAAEINASSSSSACYVPINSPDHELLKQGPGVVAAFEISADSTPEDILTAHSAPQKQEHNIELQRKNIAEIVKNKNLRDLRNFGGVRGVAEALNTDLEKGISSPREICLSKQSPLPQVLLSFFHSFLGACNNYTIFLLTCAALLSLGFGIDEEGIESGWYNTAILVSTIFILVICATIHKCLEKRSQKKFEDSWHSKGGKMQVLVVRGGGYHFVREMDVEVGDIVILRKGDRVPADGLFITGQALELENGLIRSTSIDEKNPFLFYGCRVVNGDGRMLVTSAIMDTTWGEMMSRASESSAENKCKFESCLHNLNTCMHITGLLISILIIIVMFLRYKSGKLDDERRYRPDSKGEPARVTTLIEAMKGVLTGSRGTARSFLTTLLSVSLLGIMEGMPLVISLAAIIWSRKTLRDKATERDYLGCLKTAHVTTICTDKFGGLSEHEYEVDKFFVGEEFISESTVVASSVLEGLCDGIGTLFLLPPNESVVPLISWAEAKLGLKRESVIEQCRIISCRGPNSLQESCQVLIEKNGNDRFCHCKGGPEDILSLCSHYCDSNGHKQRIDGRKRSLLEQAVGYMQAEEAVVVAFAYKEVKDSDESLIEGNLILLAMISFKETNMEETKEAVSNLREGGIRTILTSGDDLVVLETIGQKCGLITHSDDLVLTASEFKVWTDQEKLDKVERIRIMGNCLPSDNILLINCLREKGKVVALVAQRTIDAPALKLANVGLTFGTWSSEVAIECCDITIWGRNNCLGFMVNIIKSGRSFQENIRKFIQLQLIITVSSSLINFTAVVFLGDAPITAVQLFWLNLSVALFGGLALLMGPSAEKLTAISAKLITKDMWRNIVIQASYQTTIFVTLQHKGQSVLGTSGAHVKSIIYNAFFLCQMFNKFIAREPQRRNILRGLFIFRNSLWFWVALVLFLMCQVVFAVAEIGLGSSPGLNLVLLGVCLLIGVVSWLLDWVGKSVVSLVDRWPSDQGGGRWKLFTFRGPSANLSRRGRGNV